MSEVTKEFLMSQYGLTEEEAGIVGYVEHGTFISEPLHKVIQQYGLGSREYALAYSGAVAHVVSSILQKFPSRNQDNDVKGLLE